MTAKKQVLFFSSVPAGVSPLRVGKEYDLIYGSLAGRKLQDQVEVGPPCLAARPEDLRRRILDTAPWIVHISGHGSGEDGLVLQDDAGNLRMVPTDALADLFQVFDGEISCVVLSCCFSVVQAEALVRYVPVVIGMKKEIGDAAALDFARGFYDGIFAGRKCEAAFQLGCNAIRLESVAGGPGRPLSANPATAGVHALPEHLKPVLLQRDDIFVHSHAGDDAWVRANVHDRLTKSGFLVSGDYLYRDPGHDPAGRTRSRQTSRQVLVAVTPEWVGGARPEDCPPADVRTARLRLLWLRGDLPPGLRDATCYDVREAAACEVAFKKLIDDFSPLTKANNRDLTRQATNTIAVIVDRMADPDVRSAVDSVRASFERCRDDLRELDRWKQLHDRLHVLYVMLPMLKSDYEAVRRAVELPNPNASPEDAEDEVEVAWYKAAAYFKENMAPSLARLLEYAAPPTFQPDDLFLIDMIDLERGRLAAAYDDHDLKALGGGVSNLLGSTEQEMAVVDQKLSDTAGRLPLTALIEAMTQVGRAVAKLSPDDPSAAGEYAAGIRSVQELQARLQVLISNHRCLQIIDQQAGDFTVAKIEVERLQQIWARILPLVNRLRPAGPEDWVGKMHAKRAGVDAAFAAVRPADPTATDAARKAAVKAVRTVRSEVSDFHALISTAFLIGDEDLKSHCGNLLAIGASLDRAIEKLGGRP